MADSTNGQSNITNEARLAKALVGMPHIDPTNLKPDEQTIRSIEARKAVMTKGGLPVIPHAL